MTYISPFEKQDCWQKVPTCCAYLDNKFQVGKSCLTVNIITYIVNNWNKQGETLQSQRMEKLFAYILYNLISICTMAARIVKQYNSNTWSSINDLMYCGVGKWTHI